MIRNGLKCRVNDQIKRTIERKSQVQEYEWMKLTHLFS